MFETTQLPIRVSISARALFNMQDGHKIFIEKGADAFDSYMLKNKNKPLRPGPVFSLVKALLSLNSPGVRDKVEILVCSRNSPCAGSRVLKSIQHYGLDIERAFFTQGGNRFKIAKAAQTDILLSLHAQDVRLAIENGIAAAHLFDHEPSEKALEGPISIAVDGDGLAFDDSSEAVYKEFGLDKFQEHELANSRKLLGKGPLWSFIEKIAALRDSLPEDKADKLRLSLVTARGIQAHERVLRTFQTRGVKLDDAFFCGGLKKGAFLEAMGADIFFDDQVTHTVSARESGVLGGHVPYGVANKVPAIEKVA